MQHDGLAGGEHGLDLADGGLLPRRAVGLTLVLVVDGGRLEVLALGAALRQALLCLSERIPSPSLQWLGRHARRFSPEGNGNVFDRTSAASQ